MDGVAAARERTPGMHLHAAIENNDWPKAQAVLALHGAAAGATKNLRGSTPLMLAADGKCGRQNKLLIEGLLAEGNGGAASAAERNKKGKTAADIAEARGALALSSRLRALEATAAVDETFVRCSHCAAKLRARSRLAFLRDQVMRGKETNSLVLELCQDSAAVEALDVPALHRVNSCLAFRKELTESMALVLELKRLRRAADSAAAYLTASNDQAAEVPVGAHTDDIEATDVGPDLGCSGSDGSKAAGMSPQSSIHGSILNGDKVDEISGTAPLWAGWHIIDLCCGAQCVTAALCLSLLPGVTVTAIDLAPFSSLPHFHEAGLATVENLVPANGSSSMHDGRNQDNCSSHPHVSSNFSSNYDSDHGGKSAGNHVSASGHGSQDDAGHAISKDSRTNLEPSSISSNSTGYFCRTTPDNESLASFGYMQEDIHNTNLAARLCARIVSTNINRNHRKHTCSQEDISSRSSTTPYCGSKVVVMAMHCCGALSVRAIELFAQLDATALLLMPCCLPPKGPRASTTWNPVQPNQAPPTATEKDIKMDEEDATEATASQYEYTAKSQYENICGPAAMQDVFATKDQGEQYTRWAQHLCKTCTGPTGTSGTATAVPSIGVSAADNCSIVAQVQTMTAVLSDRNALITGLRRGGYLD